MGKGRGIKGSWTPGKGAWGKGGKGIYGFEDDWSEGYGGYAFGPYGDIEALSLSQEWQTPSPKNTFKPVMAATRASGPGVCQSRKCGCSVPIRNALSTGRFDVLSEVGYDPKFSDYDQSDHDLDIPMLMVLEG
jgi:hypothetical protein